MDFPAYVPAAVRVHISKLIDGDSPQFMGWAEELARAERQLAKIKCAIEAKTRLGEVNSRDGLRKQRAKALKHRNTLAGDVDCLRSLAHDRRMSDAFALLTRVFTRDTQWRRFIFAAWVARMDYSRYRNQLQLAAELKAKIAKTADTLGELIRRYYETA